MGFVENITLFSLVQNCENRLTFNDSFHRLYNVLFLWTTVCNRKTKMTIVE